MLFVFLAAPRRQLLWQVLRRGLSLRWHMLFLFLSTLLIGFGIQEGFVHAQVNNFSDQAVQLPILYSYADDTLFEGDLLLEARNSYVTLLYPALGILSRFLPLDMLLLGLYVISLGMTVTGMYYLAETLFPGKQVGPIAVLLWTVWLPNPGGDFLHSAFPTHTTTAIGIQLIALTLALRDRHLLAALLIGISANINAMTALSFAIVWGFWLLRDRENWSWSLWRIPAVIGITALPVLIWKLTTSSAFIEETTVPVETFVEIMRARLWYAIFPFSVSVQLWALFGLVLGTMVFASRFAPSETNKKILWMSQGIVLLAAIGTIFTEIIPVKMLMELQLVRSTWVLNLFATLYFANMIRFWLNGNRRHIMLALGLTIILVIPRIVIELYPIANPLPYDHYLDLDATQDGTRLTVLEGIGLGIVIIGLVWTIYRMRAVRGELTPEGAFQTNRLVGWFLFAVVFMNIPLLLDTNVPQEQRERSRQWEEVQVWVRDNTPRDAQFITPPTLDGFRLTAERSHFTDWKDGTLLIFDSDLAVEWYDRMQLLGFDPKTFSFLPVTQGQICAIATEYPMDYVIALQHWEIAGDAVFQNDGFTVIPVETIPCNYTLADS